MSGTLKVTTLQDGASATANMTFDTSGNTTAGGTVAMASSFKRNRIINGNMLIDQRNSGASVTITAGSTAYVIDRWLAGYVAGGNAIVQRVSGPNTIDYALQCQPQTSNTQTNIEQRIEYQNVLDLQAKQITISGKVYVDSVASGSAQIFYYYYNSSNVQVFVSLGSVALTAGQYVSFSKTTTLPANLYPSTSGTPNSIGLGVILEMDNSAGRTFKWTNIQLEVGSIATPYETQIYSDQLAQCQRYYYRLKAATSYANAGVGRAYSTTNCQAFVAVPVSMRAAPTGSYSALSDWNDSGGGTPSVIDPVSQYSADYRQMTINMTGTYVSGQVIALNANNTTNAWMAWSAEL